MVVVVVVVVVGGGGGVEMEKFYCRHLMARNWDILAIFKIFAWE